MIRDIVRAVCCCVVMAVAAALVIETRFQLAAIRRAELAVAPTHAVNAPPTHDTPGPLARLGRATVGLADAAIGVIR